MDREQALALWEAAVSSRREDRRQEQEARRQEREEEQRRLREESEAALKAARQAERERRQRRVEVRRTHYYLAQLKARGWTEGEVRRFLGDPDTTLSNPCWGQGAPMRCYRRERVEAVEQSSEYQAYHEQTERRRAAAKQRAERSREELVAPWLRHEIRARRQQRGEPVADWRAEFAQAREQARERDGEE
jgi:hypothetical protein